MSDDDLQQYTDKSDYYALDGEALKPIEGQKKFKLILTCSLVMDRLQDNALAELKYGKAKKKIIQR
jgi:hypothetical protein